MIRFGVLGVYTGLVLFTLFIQYAGFTYFTIVQCNRWYQYDVPTAEWLTGEVEGHTVSCDPGALLSLEDIQSALADLLAGHGYDVSSLR